ncbi:MAG: hypothetical protein ACYDER_09635 [Ktedonobacteraceae bacterium]
MSASTSGTDDSIKTVYQAHCTQYENIMGRRFQCLTLVPGSTVASFAITLLSDPAKTPSLKNLILPLGLVGIWFLIALFIIVRISFREGKLLYNRIQEIEAFWKIPPRVSQDDSLFSQVIVASILFSVSLAGWICVAMWFVFPGTAIYISSAITLPLFIVSFMLLNTGELSRSDNASHPLGNMFIPNRQG